MHALTRFALRPMTLGQLSVVMGLALTLTVFLDAQATRPDAPKPDAKAETVTIPATVYAELQAQVQRQQQTIQQLDKAITSWRVEAERHNSSSVQCAQQIVALKQQQEQRQAEQQRQAASKQPAKAPAAKPATPAPQPEPEPAKPAEVEKPKP